MKGMIDAKRNPDRTMEFAAKQCMRVVDKSVTLEVATGLRGIGGRIRKLRQASGFTLTDVGDMIGINREQVRQYEMGGRVPSVAMLMIFAAFYGVSMDWLCTGKEW